MKCHNYIKVHTVLFRVLFFPCFFIPANHFDSGDTEYIMRLLIVANPSVGIDKKKKSAVEHIASLMSGKDGNADITYTFKPGLGEKYASLSAFEGYNAVYAAGGDGTINDVASGLVGTDIPLGIIPLGTGNGFARGLNIPLDQKGFTEVLLRNRTQKIDTGKISGHYFFATSGIGFDAKIAYDFNKSHKISRALFRYFIIGIKNYFLNRTENLTLIVDGVKIKRSIFGLTIANTPQYGGGAVIAPQANPYNGKLIAIIIPKINIFKAIPAIKKLFNGSVNELSQLEFIEFKSLKIIREKAGFYHVDGEIYKGTAHLNITVLPSSLKVIVP